MECLDVLGKCVVSQQISSDITVNAERSVPTVIQITEKYVIVAMLRGEIHVFATNGTAKKILSSSEGAVWALAAQADVLASAGTDNSIEIWNLATAQHQQTLQGHTSTVRSLAILHDKNRLFSASRDTKIRVWNIAEGICMDVIAAHTGTVRVITLSKAGDLLVSGGDDGTASIWRIANDGLVRLHILNHHENGICRIAFLGNGRSQVATAGFDGALKIWDVQDGKCLANLQEHSNVINQVIVADSQLITSDAAGFVCIWSKESPPKLAHRLKAHHSSVIDLDLYQKRVVSGGKDRSVKLWNLESGNLVGQVGEVTTALWKTRFLQDGRLVLVVARDEMMVMEIWEVGE